MSSSSSVTMRQMPLILGSEPPLRFDNFIAVDPVQEAGLRAALEDPRPDVPVYLWGPPGSGKSHLLHAAAAAAQADGLRVAAFGHQVPLPWDVDDGVRLLVLDDCDQYDAHQQHAAFAAYVEAASLGVPVIAAGRWPPVDMPVRDDLRSRLGWGLVFQLQPLPEAAVRDILRGEARRRGWSLGDEVLDYLLRRCDRNLHHLMDLLDQIDRFALSAQRSVTVPLVREWLQLPLEGAV